MISIALNQTDSPKILCLGAHSDDIEIGAGATILSLAAKYPQATICWVVFSARGARLDEAKSSAKYFSHKFHATEIVVHEIRDGFFPSSIETLKPLLEELKEFNPDIVFTHYRNDLHQDHRTVSDLTWQTFRDHLILEYEIPKYDGDLGSPNVFHPVSIAEHSDKLAALNRFFVSQKDKSWFSDDMFSALMRLRGVECNSSSGFAEAFYCRKLVF